MTLATIQESALQLPAKDKVALIDLLWDSLGRDEIAAREQKWAAESEERIEAVDRGELSAVDGEEALRNLRNSLRK